MFVYELSGCGFESRCCHVNTQNEMRKVFMNVVLKFTEKIDFASFMKDIRWFIAILRAREQY